MACRSQNDLHLFFELYEDKAANADLMCLNKLLLLLCFRVPGSAAAFAYTYKIGNSDGTNCFYFVNGIKFNLCYDI